MKDLSYSLSFHLAAKIKEYLQNLPFEQKLELSIALAQRSLDERRSAALNDLLTAVDDHTFECEACHQHQPYAMGQHDEFYELCDDCFIERDTTPTYDPAELIV
jgi:hypothetical protein